MLISNKSALRRHSQSVLCVSMVKILDKCLLREGEPEGLEGRREESETQGKAPGVPSGCFVLQPVHCFCFFWSSISSFPSSFYSLGS